MCDLTNRRIAVRPTRHALLGTSSTPLIEHNPLLFWQALSFLLLLVILELLFLHFSGRG
jgi:hypothetical protein